MRAGLVLLLGVTAALQEGLELNLLGLILAVDPLGPAIKLPGIGRLVWALDRQSPPTP